MTLNQLKMLVAVAKYQNITKAAIGIHVSQPSISQQLKLLEEEYGVILFKKNGQGIELTQTGQLFLENAESILTQVRKLEQNFKENYRKTRSLKIGSCLNPSVTFLPTIMAAFKMTHPEVQLSLQSGNSSTLERLVMDSELEFSLITNPTFHPALLYEPCRQCSIVVVTSPKHPLAKRAALGLAGLHGVPLVIIKSKENTGKTVAEQILEKIRKKGIELTVGLYSDSPEAAKAAIKSGVGMGLLYRDYIEPETLRGDLRIIEISELEMKVTTCIIRRKKTVLSPNGKDFLTLLRQWSRNNRQAKVSSQVL